MRDSVRSTYTSAVLAGIGAFGGLFDTSSIKNFHHPVLVASTDGVGTKVRLAAQFNRYESIGKDIVNHCINDILVQGADPLFFLDYFACSKLDPMVASRIVSGISSACREAGCVLIGGETAEMPGVYADGEFDLAGTIVGVVEKDRVLPRDTLRKGDLLVGFGSSGPHTNGFSLIRKVLQGYNFHGPLPGSGITMLDALLEPHRSYLAVLKNVLISEPNLIKALAHITGGGFIENIPRILPDGLQAVIRQGSWAVPDIFHALQQAGDITDKEMFRVFNMGIGMIAVVSPDDIVDLKQQVSEEIWVIGQLVDGNKGVALI
jgi:phosphoribosylformylglycinamidine cyclo-ligase